MAFTRLELPVCWLEDSLRFIELGEVDRAKEEVPPSRLIQPESDSLAA